MGAKMLLSAWGCGDADVKLREGAACDAPPNWKGDAAGAAEEGWEGAAPPNWNGEEAAGAAGAPLPNAKGVDAPEFPPAGVVEPPPKANMPPAGAGALVPLPLNGLLTAGALEPPKVKEEEADPLV